VSSTKKKNTENPWRFYSSPKNIRFGNLSHMSEAHLVKKKSYVYLIYRKPARRRRKERTPTSIKEMEFCEEKVAAIHPDALTSSDRKWPEPPKTLSEFVGGGFWGASLRV